MHTDTHFQAKQLTVGYNGRAVVQDVTVTVPRGQILTLIGPNGAGKSTILKSIAKQLTPVSGSACIGGVSIADIRPGDFAKQAAVVLTKRPRPERMTCWDVAAVGRYPYTGMLGILSENDKAKVREALALVGAENLAERSFDEISDGQMQRILLARAICQEPDIIILDEPTAFLDIRFAAELLDILRRMADERGVTVILSLHELMYAKRVADLVIGIKDGLATCLGTPDEVFTEAIISRLYGLPDGLYAELFGGL